MKKTRKQIIEESSKAVTTAGKDWFKEPSVPLSKDEFHKRMKELEEEVKAVGKEKESVNHPQHYGGDTTYEAIKVIKAWKLGFCLGNTVKYISRAGKKDPSKEIEDLEKAAWYLNEEIKELKKQRLDIFESVKADILKTRTKKVDTTTEQRRI